MAVDVTVLTRRILAARGLEPCDLSIEGAQLVDVASGSVRNASVGIVGDTIVSVGEPRPALRVVEARGRFLAPGFIDTHVHVESSLVTPAEFERLVLPRGTTTAICDPHEIANVTGTEGIAWFLEAATTLVMSLKVNLPSCVPASELETAGARLEVDDLLPLAAHPSALGLAEMMNFPGVIEADLHLLRKLAAFADKPIDGHAPLLMGEALDAYLCGGPRTDHECTILEEAREKLEKGMIVLMREGSVTRNVAALAALLTEATWPRIAFCTDDRKPVDIIAEGHIDHAMRAAITAGAPVIPVYRSASLTAATAFRLYDRGLIAPGRRADLVLVDELETVSVSGVVAAGQVVEATLFQDREHPEPVGYRSVLLPPVDATSFAIPAPKGDMDVIGVVPLSVITEHRREEPPVEDGLVVADPERSLHLIAVLERHGRNGNIGRGLVHGFGPMHGALACSIGHDSHNVTVVGSNAEDMAVAVNRIAAIQGGIVAVRDRQVLAELALPVAGLMSDRPFEEVAERFGAIRTAVHGMGCPMPEPLQPLAFLPLSVIPHLKLTDRGYVTAGPEGLKLLG
ncbi:MAG TPA: adenine deaminase [Geminicoccus sp.]|jgi:adenine deaminase|uniref:adenine deaminase n=1 Tax=Geminicoccus sp. TaxID=2024832 RepID=UPI002E2F2C50|nr:adenine deaminase [Geminicoccus sp.]HEX2526139.1 adenine deaminase [Geminicoccus sp.]